MHFPEEQALLMQSMNSMASWQVHWPVNSHWHSLAARRKFALAASLLSEKFADCRTVAVPVVAFTVALLVALLVAATGTGFAALICGLEPLDFTEVAALTASWAFEAAVLAWITCLDADFTKELDDWYFLMTASMHGLRLSISFGSVELMHWYIWVSH